MKLLTSKVLMPMQKVKQYNTTQSILVIKLKKCGLKWALDQIQV